MAIRPHLLSEVRFGAFLTYSPRGRSEVSTKSRMFRDAVKFDRPGVIRDIVTRLKAVIDNYRLGDFLAPNVTLVPVPRSAPIKDPDTLWPPLRICQELHAQELGGRILPCLTRKRAVQKAAYAAPGGRPTAQMHLESMAMQEQRALDKAERITVIDDFVTRGDTLLAAASLVQWAFPDALVQAFAIVRTLGLVPEIDRIIHPCVGRIRRNGDEAEREP